MMRPQSMDALPRPQTTLCGLGAEGRKVCNTQPKGGVGGDLMVNREATVGAWKRRIGNYV